jgi:hypothetical protein
MPNIGIVSTIAYNNTTYKTRFETGLGGTATWDISDNLGYDDNALRTAVQNYDVAGTYDLIVTLGGLKAAIAALGYANNVHFISIVGGVIPAGGGISAFPGTITGKFWGGIDLETFKHNDKRVDYLTGDDGTGHHNFQHGHVCLLVHMNSPCHDPEKGDWEKARPGKPARGKVREASDLQGIRDAFKALGHLKAMVVSADPIFNLYKPDLIDAANHSGLHMCYPLQDYQYSSTPPTGHYTLHGPDLAQAHEDLGKKAKSILTTGAGKSLDAATQLLKDT